MVTRSLLDRQMAEVIRQRVREQVAPYQTTIPVPVDTLAERHGMTILSAPSGVDYEGLTMYEDDEWFIVINRNRPRTAQRFALAHEWIGHIGYHYHDLTHYDVTRYLRRPLYPLWETEANTAAAEFLLPYAWMCEEADRRWHGRLLTPEAFHEWYTSSDARAWARAADVSRSQLGWQVIDLGFADPKSRPFVWQHPRPCPVVPPMVPPSPDPPDSPAPGVISGEWSAF